MWPDKLDSKTLTCCGILKIHPARLAYENANPTPSPNPGSEWRPIETAPRKTEILIAKLDFETWTMDSGFIEDWEDQYPPERMRWMPLPRPPKEER
jgi:hypothetical protein